MALLFPAREEPKPPTSVVNRGGHGSNRRNSSPGEGDAAKARQRIGISTLTFETVVAEGTRLGVI